jgi:molybdopterin-guanine dinucleotide biosynthesis protein A
MKPPCVILAGGRSSRMGGGDKCLLPLDGQPLLNHILRTVAPQAIDILLNANSNPGLFARFGPPVRADTVPDFQGPLAGLLTGLHWARQRHPSATHLLSVSCDTPFLPADLVARLDTERLCQQAEIAIARDPERVHPTIGLWPVALSERLEADLRNTDCRAIYRWLGNFRVAETPFPATHFRNINTPDDLAAATKFYPQYATDLTAL